MAEAIAAFGAAASAVQLADVALRASREAYRFLSAINNAAKEVQDLKETLQDVDTNVRSLRDYVDAFSRSNAARGDFETLPDVISGSISRFHQDIQLLNSILPQESSPTLTQKVRFACKKQDIKRILNRLRDRKTDVHVAVSIAGRLHDLCIIKETGNLSSNLQSSMSMIVREIGQSQQALDTIKTGVSDIVSTTTVTPGNADILTRVFRAELETTLKPIVEQTFAKSTVRNEALLRGLAHSIDSLSLDLGRRISKNSVSKSTPEENSPRSSKQQDEASCAKSLSDSSSLEQSNPPQLNNFMDRRLSPSAASPNKNFVTYQGGWFFDLRLGTIVIEIESLCRRETQASSYHSYFTIKIHFRPSAYFFGLPGVSLLYTTAPNHHGYYQIAPMITIIPIVRRDHPIYFEIEEGNLAEIQRMISMKEVSPRCETIIGETLPLYAAVFGQFEIFRYFMSLDLDPLRKAIFGANALDVWFVGAFVLPTHRYRLWNKLDYSYSIGAINIIEETGDYYSETESFWIREGALRIKLNELGLEDTEMDKFRDFIAFLLQKSNHAWNITLEFLPKFWRLPCKRAKRYVKLLLEIGLDPNFIPKEYQRCLLIQALDGVRRTRDINNNSRDKKTANLSEMGEQTAPEAPVSMKDDSESEELSIEEQDCDITGAYTPLWCLLELLISFGADIFYLEYHDEKDTIDWQNIWTPTDYAIKWRVEAEWCAALKACDYDPSAVYEESNRRKIDFLKLHGAQRSGVDVEDLKSPTAIGLQCRRPWRTENE